MTFCKVISQTKHNIFCIGGDKMQSFRIFNKQLTEEEYHTIGREIMEIFPIVKNAPFMGFWDSIHPNQWDRLSQIKYFDSAVVEKITLKNIWNS